VGKDEDVPSSFSEMAGEAIDAAIDSLTDIETPFEQVGESVGNQPFSTLDGIFQATPLGDDSLNFEYDTDFLNGEDDRDDSNGYTPSMGYY